MSRAKPPLLSLLALFLVLGACQSEGKIEGEVFIVTEGRENIELGLVEVSAVEVEKVDKRFEERLSTSRKHVKSSASRISTLLDSVSNLNSLSSQVSSTHRDLNSKRNKLKKKINRVDEKIQKIEGRLVKNKEKGVKEDKIGKKDEVSIASDGTEVYNGPDRDFTVVERLDSGDRVKIVDIYESSFYKVSFDNREFYVHPYDILDKNKYQEIINEKRNNIKIKDNLKEKLNYLDKKRGKELEKISVIENKIDNIVYSVNSEMGVIESHRRSSFFLDELPRATSTDMTDSDGRYQLTVQAGVPYYVVAEAERSVGDRKEEYHWMVETTVSGGEAKEVNLTNDNLGGVPDKKYALDERTLSTVEGIWQSAISLAKEGKEMNWEKLIYRTAFPEDTTEVPIPDELDVPEEKLLSNR